MKILLLDIENEYHTAGVWGMRDINVAVNQLLTHGRILCVAYKWLGDKQVHFVSTWTHGRKRMLRAIHKALDEADAVMGYNHVSHDLKWLNTEFLAAGLPPTPPCRQIDLLRVVRNKFKFPSNKLEYVAPALGVGAKVKHAGHELWVKTMAGDAAARKEMQRYNEQDTLLLESLYGKLQAWVPNHPDRNLYLDETSDVPLCSHCEGKLQRRGSTYTTAGRFQRFACMSCGAWHRGTKNLSAKRLTRKDG